MVPSPTPEKHQPQAEFLEAMRVCEVFKTARLLLVCATVVIVVAIAAYVIVRIYTYDFWWELILLLLSPTGLAAALIFALLKKLSGKVRRLQRAMPGPKLPEVFGGDKP